MHGAGGYPAWVAKPERAPPPLAWARGSCRGRGVHPGPCTKVEIHRGPAVRAGRLRVVVAANSFARVDVRPCHAGPAPAPYLPYPPPVPCPRDASKSSTDTRAPTTPMADRYVYFFGAE